MKLFLRQPSLIQKGLVQVKLNYSALPNVEREKTSMNEQLEILEKITSMNAPRRIKKAQKPPFAKNLFLGTFDTDILTYPQLEKDELNALEENLRPVKDFFRHPEVLQTRDFRKSFNNLKLFGLRVPQTSGGRGLTVTENCKFHEIIAQHSLYKCFFQHEQFGVQAMFKMGSDALKNKYLAPVICGESLTALCTNEVKATKNTIPTTATRLNPDTWVLSGEKFYVVNGSIAELFIVLAETRSVKRYDIKDTSSTAFVVERGFEGVSVEKVDNLAHNEIDIAKITFQNTPIPNENIIGTVHAGDIVVANTLNEMRLTTGPSCITRTKSLIEYFANEQKKLAEEDSLLMQSELICNEISESVIYLYAMESVTYLTSCLLDQYENQDCSVESAIVKVFCSEHSSRLALRCLEYTGPPGYLTENRYNKIYRASLGDTLLNESNSSLKLVIALMGIQHAGKHLQETVSKFRNPMLFPLDTIKRMLYQRRQFQDLPKLNLGLQYHLHPSAVQSAKLLEYCVLRLQFATEVLLVNHGAEVVNVHCSLKNLADCVIDIYAMVASLGRASRSYCIGNQHAAQELLIASTFCSQAASRVKQNVNSVCNDYSQQHVNSFGTIASDVYKFECSYFPVHPLTRNI